MKPVHWLAGVARVLRSQSDDLRELAQIGGVDPRTAYVGTRLDGADLRGQDLRGMLFTDLDLARVRHDAGTQIDPDQIARAEPASAGSVFIASRSLAGDPIAGYLAGRGARVFHPKDLPAFQASLRPGMPAIVLATSNEIYADRTPLDRLAKLDENFVLVVVGASPKPLRDEWLALGPSAPAVFCSSAQRLGGGRSPRPKPDARVLCSLLLEHWDPICMHLDRTNVFLTPQPGLEPLPWLDEGAQLFEQIWRLELPGRAVTLVGRRDTASPLEDKALHRLVRPNTFIQASGFRGDLYAIVADQAAGQSQAYWDDLADVTISALQLARQGDERVATIRDAEGRRMTVERAPFGGRQRSSGLVRANHFDHFDLSRVENVIIADRADVTLIVDRLIFAHELWVTPRDLLGAAAAPELTIWSLLGAILRRSVGAPGNGLRLLLTLILRLGSNEREQRAALELLETPGSRVWASALDFQAAHTSIGIDISPGEGGPTFPNANFVLVLDPIGSHMPSGLDFTEWPSGQEGPAISLPGYGEIEHALLLHLLKSGPVAPKDVYDALAIGFGLGREQREVTRKDNSTPLWNNRVQWARRALKDKGYLAGRPGVWELTPEGVEMAKRATPPRG